MRVASVVLALVAAACSAPEDPASVPACDASAVAAVAPGTPGPFRTGYRSFQHTYEAPGIGTRTITVNLWYPTTDEAGAPSRYVGLQEDPRAFLDADVAPPVSGCGYPVAVYSHGARAWGGSASFSHHHLVSQGFVVVAPDHAGNTLTDPDPPDWMHYVRGHDVSAAIDAAGKLPASDPLAGKLRLEKVFLSGHSYGGHTAWAVAGAKFDTAAIQKRCTDGKSDAASCTPAVLAAYAKGVRDPRVIAVGALDGEPTRDWFGEAGQNEVKIPLLQFSGTNSQRTIPELYERTSGVPLTWVELEGACHETFASGLIPCDTMSTDEGYPIVRAYVAAFARHHLLGDRSPDVVGLVDGTQRPSDKVRYRRK
jgi:predicted dienelactone hydrolase